MAESSQKKVIAFTGRKACGKGVAGNALVQSYSAYAIDYSACLHDVLAIMGIDDSQDHIAKLSMFLRSRYGSDVFQHAVSKKIAQAPNNLISLFGARRLSDFDSLKRDYRFFLIYIDSDYTFRYQRYANRSKAGDNGSDEAEFRRKDEEEPELQIESLKDMADIVIENNGTLEEFQHKLSKVFTALHL